MLFYFKITEYNTKKMQDINSNPSWVVKKTHDFVLIKKMVEYTTNIYPHSAPILSPLNQHFVMITIW